MMKMPNPPLKTKETQVQKQNQWCYDYVLLRNPENLLSMLNKRIKSTQRERREHKRLIEQENSIELFGLYSEEEQYNIWKMSEYNHCKVLEIDDKMKEMRKRYTELKKRLPEQEDNCFWNPATCTQTLLSMPIVIFEKIMQLVPFEAKQVVNIASTHLQIRVLNCHFLEVDPYELEFFFCRGNIKNITAYKLHYDHVLDNGSYTKAEQPEKWNTDVERFRRRRINISVFSETPLTAKMARELADLVDHCIVMKLGYDGPAGGKIFELAGLVNAENLVLESQVGVPIDFHCRNLISLKQLLPLDCAPCQNLGFLRTHKNLQTLDIHIIHNQMPVIDSLIMEWLRGDRHIKQWTMNFWPIPPCSVMYLTRDTDGKCLRIKTFPILQKKIYTVFESEIEAK